jgi:hypothetical protein
MVIDKVKNATTRDSAIHYQITMRVWSQELKGDPLEDMERGGFAEQLAHRVRKAIEGIE